MYPLVDKNLARFNREEAAVQGTGRDIREGEG